MTGSFVGAQLRRWSDHESSGSIASRCRSSRFSVLAALLKQLPRPVRILDIGGEEGFWAAMKTELLENLEVTLLNLLTQPAGNPRFRRVSADARRIPFLSNGEFDVAFSNSVIEHLGSLEDQGRMAAEVQRVAKRYFVQTPSRWFPLEPHFLFPYFQWLPFSLRVWIASHYRSGWYCRPGDRVAARKEVESIRLLTKRECRQLFPGAEVRTERLFGLAKSYMILGGWGHCRQKAATNSANKFRTSYRRLDSIR